MNKLLKEALEKLKTTPIVCEHINAIIEDFESTFPSLNNETDYEYSMHILIYAAGMVNIMNPNSIFSKSIMKEVFSKKFNESFTAH